ncbi:hypothetical protein [Lacimicrobium alkaliphilum]|uniref:hypothetical protein n=1 Tax=Lacimicrobium alkaliphilum TaxID=1526571 RepID=UPI00117BD81A|nr:hypothetical protein [Lacimicrobium alkaliphilum]
MPTYDASLDIAGECFPATPAYRPFESGSCLFQKTSFGILAFALFTENALHFPGVHSPWT